MITTVDWDDGSGDKIYISADAFGGNQNVLVSSDANAGSARTKNVSFQANGITRVLTVNQAGIPQQHTVQINPSAYIPKATDGAWYSLSDSANAYDDENSTTYAMIRLTRGSSGAITYIYFTFDTSIIPAGATIDSVTIRAKIFISNASSNNVAVRQCQMFAGTTAKGSAQNATTTSRVVTFSGQTWTRQELNDIRIRLYAERGTKNLNNDYVFRFYGATLEITYTY